MTDTNSSSKIIYEVDGKYGKFYIEKCDDEFDYWLHYVCDTDNLIDEYIPISDIIKLNDSINVIKLPFTTTGKICTSMMNNTHIWLKCHGKGHYSCFKNNFFSILY